MTAQRKEYKKELASLRKEQRRLEREINTHEKVLVRIKEASIARRKKATATHEVSLRKIDGDAAQQTRKISAYIRTQGREHTATTRRIAILEGRLSS